MTPELLLPVFLFFWIISAIFVIIERRIYRLLVTTGIFSCISFVCFLLLASPDVAMAQAVISAFSTIMLIVTFEKYYTAAKRSEDRADTAGIIKKAVLPACFCLLLFFMFIYFMPPDSFVTDLRDQYVSMFRYDIGGENAVTAIYLGYRLYDTLFEALILLVSIMAVVHLSQFDGLGVSKGRLSDILSDKIAVAEIRFICPLMLLFCIYLIMNGHISPGGGFQGGVVAASVFVCRYLILNIYDIPIDKIITVEKLIFAAILLTGALFILLAAHIIYPVHQAIYLIAMNLLIGLKVACGFLIVFYRFIAFERR